MVESRNDAELDELSVALGPDNVLGFHIEAFGQTSLFWDRPRRGDGTRFPCIDAGNAYTGCLGADCQALHCWAGRLVASAANAPSERIPLPREERRGATCHTCVHAVGDADGFIDCRRDHFDRPISMACLVRRRIPPTAPIPCPDYQQAEELHPEVEEFRRLKREALARRRPHGEHR